MPAPSDSTPLMEEIVSLCRRRGFVFQSSEIYGGINGFFDYGPLGVEVRNRIKAAWWQDMVHRREDIVGLDASIIMNPKVWEASEHVDAFSDPLVDCTVSKMRYRADRLFFAPVSVQGEAIGYVSVVESATMGEEALEKAEALKRKLARRGRLAEIVLKEYSSARPDEYSLIPSPATGEPGSLTPPREFNLMFQTHVGALRDQSSVAYLRPETAQGIFVNFKNIVATGRVKIPFGIAQIGKSFRNEITPRNFVFRSREFEQMEMEYFIPPGDEVWPKYHREWMDRRMNWYTGLGIPRSQLSEDVHPREKLSHYSLATTDITFAYPFGVHELEGIAARGNYDLNQHERHSGKSMEYFDEVRKERYVPHVVEPAAGVDRAFLALLCAAYCVDEVDGELRVVLRFHPRIAPYTAAVFPLLRNRAPLVEKARGIFAQLQSRWNVCYDQSGAIGRRYRRQDEIGTPFAITVDFQSLDDDTVTVRDRDTTEQVRISETEIAAFIEDKTQG